MEGRDATTCLALRVTGLIATIPASAALLLQVTRLLSSVSSVVERGLMPRFFLRHTRTRACESRSPRYA